MLDFIHKHISLASDSVVSRQVPAQPLWCHQLAATTQS